jgi:hypothetical protein
VRGVDLDGVEAGPLGSGGRVGEGPDDPLDAGPAHLTADERAVIVNR